MPQLGETVTEGTIVRWLKAVGEPVAEDEILFEVSTDKVDSEVPSPSSGYVTDILVAEGETVDVGARLAVIASEAPTGAPAGASSSDGAAIDGAIREEPDLEAASDVVAAESARAKDAAASTAPAPPPAPAPSAPGAGDDGAGAAGGASRVLSPVVRRLLAEHGIDPSEVQGSGSGGRITRADVLALVDARSTAPATASGPPAPARPAPAAAPARPTAAPPWTAPAAPAPPATTPPGAAPVAPPVTAEAGGGQPRDEVVPFTNIRRRTAEHMMRSRATSAHTMVSIEADFEAVERVRRAHRERFRAEEGVSLTYLPFVLRATVDALRAFPRLNASVGEGALVVHHDLHLGIAVDLDAEGLIVPVIHHADTWRLPALAREVAALASRARSRSLTADDIAGGTFTISNPGPFGTLMTIPIINQPQVAILSTDGIKRRPVVVTAEDGGESIAVHSVGVLALSFDHRAVDGAYAAAFLARMREVIETHDWVQEL